MAKYIVLHTLKKSPEEVSKALNEGAPEMARAMAAGETACKCLKTWSPLAHGRTDYMFCLWEADKPEDVEARLDGSTGLLQGKPNSSAASLIIFMMSYSLAMPPRRSSER